MHLGAEVDLGGAEGEAEEVDAGVEATAAAEEVGVVAEAEVRVFCAELDFYLNCVDLQVEGEAHRAGVAAAAAAGVDLVVVADQTEEAAGAEADAAGPVEEAGPTSLSSLTDTPAFSLQRQKTTCS